MLSTVLAVLFHHQTLLQFFLIFVGVISDSFAARAFHFYQIILRHIDSNCHAELVEASAFQQIHRQRYERQY
jgi:hypothetical protein